MKPIRQFFPVFFATLTLLIPPMSSTCCLPTIDNVCPPYIYCAPRRLLLILWMLWADIMDIIETYGAVQYVKWCPIDFFVNLQGQ